MRLVRRKRNAKIIAMFVLLLPALLGILSLVVDLGIMLAMQRHAQNAADAAAVAAAQDLLTNRASTMSATASAAVHACSNLGTAQVQVHCPPCQGNFAGNSQYVEIIVTVPVDTYFAQVLSDKATHYLCARAVAGIESVAPHELITCLAPNAVPGMCIDGITLNVAGRIAVNSQGAGVDETNVGVDYGLPASAVALPNGGTLCSDNLRVVGGVANSSSITAQSAKSPALSARRLPRSDPFLNLPTPTVATGVIATHYGNVVKVLDADDYTLSPGIYASLKITGSGAATLTFKPGIYVFQGGNSAGNALWIDTKGTIIADGVLFYNTGASYDPITGLPDASDGNALGIENDAKFGSVQIKADNLTFTGLADAGNPFHGLLFYQRRWNAQPVSIYSGASSSKIAGTTYARWSSLSLAISGKWEGQFAVGSLKTYGLMPGNPTSIGKGVNYAKSPQVFLVE